MRISAGLLQADVGRLIETRQSRIADLEAGQSTITPGDLLLLAKGLGVTDQNHLDALLELRRNSHQRGLWTTGYHRAYREDIRLLVDLEQHADLLRGAEVEVMPGLAQCESYVRALFADRPESTNVEIDDLVAARLARQAILDKTDAPQYRVVFSESCLRRERGTPEIMREQMDHMIKLSKRPNVMLQVVPFKARPVGQTSIGTRFTLLRIPSPGIAGPLEIAYTEGVGDLRYLDDKAALIAHDNAWTRLSAGALNPADTRKFMREAASEL